VSKKLYDDKCKELAQHFLREADKLNDERRVEMLARLIQQTVDMAFKAWSKKGK
jgi:hypothetical protein